MISQHTLDKVLAIILFLCLLLYHVFDIVESSSNISQLWQVARFGTVFIAFFGVIYKVIPLYWKHFFGKSYIGGRYEGNSVRIIDRKKDETYQDKELFDIYQNLFSTTIEGTSCNKDGEFKTGWHGSLLRKPEGDSNTYYFGVEFTSSRRIGIMVITFQDNKANVVVSLMQEEGSKSFRILAEKQ